MSGLANLDSCQPTNLAIDSKVKTYSKGLIA